MIHIYKMYEILNSNNNWFFINSSMTHTYKRLKRTCSTPMARGDSNALFQNFPFKVVFLTTINSCISYYIKH